MLNLTLTIAVLDAVGVERERQARLHDDGRILTDCADPAIPSILKLPVLLNEVGEVALELSDPEHDAPDLYRELIQVAAVAVAMAEAVMIRHSLGQVHREHHSLTPIDE